VDPKEFTLIIENGRGILATMDDQGVVTFAVTAGEGASVRGTELFNRMMQFFGSGVTAIQGVWRKGPLGGPSANIDKVNELTGLGMSLEEAIMSTWTVTRAKKWGLDQVHVTGLTEGIPGAYTKIDVLIEKPKQAGDHAQSICEP